MTSSPARRAKIMVVDDDVVVLEVTRGRLESAGFEVSVRDRAFGTSAALMREQPDFVLLDVNMPGLRGDAIARMLARADGPKRTHVILYSSANRNALEALASECGALGIIQKTSDARQFLSELGACMKAAE